MITQREKFKLEINTVEKLGRLLEDENKSLKSDNADLEKEARQLRVELQEIRDAHDADVHVANDRIQRLEAELEQMRDENERLEGELRRVNAGAQLGSSQNQVSLKGFRVG